MTTGGIEEERDTHLIRLWLFLPLGYSPIPPGPQSPPLCQSRAAARKEEELCLCGMVCGVGWLERSEMGRLEGEQWGAWTRGVHVYKGGVRTEANGVMCVT
jgi:hypothetical protein